jgi:hypothetical protein
MSVITHLDGSMEADVAEGAIEALISELDHADAEHTDVSIADSSGWTLSAFADGRLIWEDAEGGVDGRIAFDVSPNDVRRLFCCVASGQLDAIHQFSWTSM